MNLLRKQVIVVGIVAGVLFGLAGLGVISQNNETKTNYDEPKQTKELEFLINYKGQDNKGSTVLEVISSIIQTYEIVYDEPNQEYKWDLTSYVKENEVYDVDYHIISERIDSVFQFTVDLNKKTVTARNTLASDVLTVVESEGVKSEQEINSDTFCTEKTRLFYEKLGMSEIYQELHGEKC